MPKPWLKMWSSSLDSEKIQSLSGDQFKAWMNLLWIALRHDHDGDLPPLPSVAFQARVSVQDATEMLRIQVELGLIEKNRNSYRIHDWKHWQGNGKSDAERKAESRDRSRDMSHNGHTPDDADLIAQSQTCHNLAGAKTKTKTKTKTEREKAAAPPDDFPLPDWLPRQDWQDWLTMRWKIKEPLDEMQMAKVIRKLERFRSEGQDPLAILEAAVIGNYQGLFAIDQPRVFRPNGSTGQPVKKHWSQKTEAEMTPEELEYAKEHLAQERRNANAASRAKRP